MALSEFEKAAVELQLEKFIEENRPPEDIRDQLDLGYRIEDQSVIIFEIRPHWRTNEVMHIDCAKTTYVKRQEIWKVYWMRQDGKWHGYEPQPEVKRLEKWLELVSEDKHACFWG